MFLFTPLLFAFAKFNANIFFLNGLTYSLESRLNFVSSSYSFGIRVNSDRIQELI